MKRALALLLGAALAVSALAQDRPKIAIGQFDSDRSSAKLDDLVAALGELINGADSGTARTVRSEVVSALVNSRRFDVYSTRDLDRIIRENRDLRGDRGPFSRLRDLTGVRYYVYGAIRKAEVKSEVSVFKSFVASVDVDYRIIDLDSGQIIYSKPFDGREKKTFVMNPEESKKQQLTDSEKADLLETAAKQSARTFVQALGRVKLEPAPEEKKPEVARGLQLEISGLESLGQAKDLESAIEHVKGVDGIKRTSYSSGYAIFEIQGKVSAEDLGIALEKSARVSELGLIATVGDLKENFVLIRVKKKS